MNIINIKKKKKCEKLDSGRWLPYDGREEQVIRCCVTDGTTEQFSGRCVIVYRLRSDIDFETKHLLDVCSLNNNFIYYNVFIN